MGNRRFELCPQNMQSFDMVKTKESRYDSPTPWESRTVRAAALTNCRKVSLLVSVMCDFQGHVHEASPMLWSHKVYNVKGVMIL